MTIELRSQDLSPCADTRDYVHAVVGRTTRFHEVTDARVELRAIEASSDERLVDCRLEVERPGRPAIRIQGRGASIALAVQEACDRLERRLSSNEASFRSDGIECKAA